LFDQELFALNSRPHIAAVLAGLVGWSTGAPLAAGCEPDAAKGAQAYRAGNQPVRAESETTVICEAEEFRMAGPGWQAQNWGSNYYAATLANTFLSRKAYLGAPEQCERAVATIAVEVPKAGRYLALVRFEAAYRFQTQFKLRIEQGGKIKLDRLYGSRDGVKIWAFREQLKKEHGWPWGAVENVVWEGHDAAVDLDAGPARLELLADRQPEPAARRNVDLVMLTSDAAQVQTRIEKENYLPLDGMLTQAGDVFLKLHNSTGGAAVTLTVPNGTEHSPYWVHLRDWKPKSLAAEPGQSTEWIEVGGQLDSLNDGQWLLAAAGKGPLNFALEFGVKTADGKIDSIARFDNLSGNVTLAYDANTRYSRRIRLADDVLYDLVNYLKAQPVHGTLPKRTLVYGYTFTESPGNARYNAAIDEFVRLIGATALVVGSRNEIPGDGPLVRGYTDLRDVPTDKLEERCQKLQAEGRADKIAVVSLGDEIGLEAPQAKDNAAFHEWLKGRQLKPSDIVPSAAGWEQVSFSISEETAKTNPRLYYYSQLYRYRHGVASLKRRTDILRRHLPHAGIGANFSPHAGTPYLGETHQWISLFREDGMTMPWGEDYIWQVPVGTQQMNFLQLDMFRAGIRGKPGAKIHFYVMPHWPGNTPASWRRQFYGALAHGVKVLNLFEFRPVQAAYTENYVNLPEMYQEVRRAVHELGGFEDIIQHGQVRPAPAALWFSEAADVWHDSRPPLAAGTRTLYIALRHQQLPLDCVVEGDELKDYRVLFLTDQHVSQAASRSIAQWVAAGGQLFATAGAGMLDEFNQPNAVLRELLGADQQALEHDFGEPIRLEKQDLPFARPMDTVTFKPTGSPATMPVFGVRSRIAAKTADVLGTFQDNSPAITARTVGQGRAVCCAFLPGLTYFKPAIPLRPADRATSDDSMAHFIPTQFDPNVSALLRSVATIEPSVTCSVPLVETTVIEATQGIVIPLINWSGRPLNELTVSVHIPVPTQSVTLASGKPVRHALRGNETLFNFDLDVADALVLR
jgi:hypothetical protein